VSKLKDEQGLSEEDAFQSAVEAILAPSDGPAMSDNPPQPRSLEEQEEVYRKLDLRETVRQRSRELRETALLE
jgi:hypothetical protein